MRVCGIRTTRPGPLRGALLGLLAVLGTGLLLGAGEAAAADDPGRTCTAPGCTGRPPPSWTGPASFGAASLAAIWIARRRRCD